MNLNNEVKEICNNKDIKLNVDKIIKNLLCYLCGGIYRNPHTFSECTDTFCKACIYKYFMKNKKKNECPKCLTNLGGRPFDSLIFDNSLNTLINIIYPELEEKENLLSTNLEKLYMNEELLSIDDKIDNDIRNVNFNDYDDCLQVRLEPDETIEESEDLLIPNIVLPKELRTIYLKRFIFRNIKTKCKNENNVILSYDNCIIDDEDLSIDDLIKLFGIGVNGITLIKYSLRDISTND